MVLRFFFFFIFTIVLLFLVFAFFGGGDHFKLLNVCFFTDLNLGHRPAPAGQEPGELGELRRKLLMFLEKSKHYTVERFATYMMNKGICYKYY